MADVAEYLVTKEIDSSPWYHLSAARHVQSSPHPASDATIAGKSIRFSAGSACHCCHLRKDTCNLFLLIAALD